MATHLQALSAKQIDPEFREFTNTPQEEKNYV
jgi:hypothetical protein